MTARYDYHEHWRDDCPCRWSVYANGTPWMVLYDGPDERSAIDIAAWYSERTGQEVTISGPLQWGTERRDDYEWGYLQDYER